MFAMIYKQIQNYIALQFGRWIKIYNLKLQIAKFKFLMSFLFFHRGDESVIYGHQNLGANVFYKQSAQSLCGLPAPVDAMGTIPKHARRSLERDHSIMLF